ncbi:MAG TPA: P-II family nitrogen regulator [Ramlibacter sp.]|uniref:P-II family nitrogen regulator n=1 Tax=Ramlibacter sp. TaxID=1917967 RepID=UPI002ED17B0B
MKWVSVLVRPFRVDEVVAALEAIGVGRLTVTEVQEWSEHTVHDPADEDEEVLESGPGFVPHLRIEMALPDEQLRRAIDAVRRSAPSGAHAEDRILVWPLGFAMRIRTAESGEAAL